MVVPLITGAVKVARKKSVLNKAGRGRKKTSPIVGRREDRAYDKHAIVNRPKDRKRTLERQAQNVRSVRDVLPYKRALKTAGKGAAKSTIKKVKVFNRAIMTLGSTTLLLGLQPMFAAVVLFSLAVDDTWWGWIDFVDASLMVATAFWAIAAILGTCAMFVATFMLAKYLLYWKTILVWILCFSGNIIPGFQLVPWAGILVLFVIWNEK